MRQFKWHSVAAICSYTFLTVNIAFAESDSICEPLAENSTTLNRIFSGHSCDSSSPTWGFKKNLIYNWCRQTNENEIKSAMDQRRDDLASCPVLKDQPALRLEIDDLHFVRSHRDSSNIEIETSLIITYRIFNDGFGKFDLDKPESKINNFPNYYRIVIEGNMLMHDPPGTQGYQPLFKYEANLRDDFAADRRWPERDSSNFNIPSPSKYRRTQPFSGISPNRIVYVNTIPHALRTIEVTGRIYTRDSGCRRLARTERSFQWSWENDQDPNPNRGLYIPTPGAPSFQGTFTNPPHMNCPI
jgi:hypothetical protein